MRKLNESSETIAISIRITRDELTRINKYIKKRKNKNITVSSVLRYGAEIIIKENKL